MPATRTKIKMITYPAADVRALRVTHAYTYAMYRRNTEDEGVDGMGRGRGEKGDRRMQGCRTVTAMFCNLN